MSKVSEAALALVDRLTPLLPASGANGHVNQVSLVSLRERIVGLGDRRGDEARGGLAVVALKGIRLEGAVRFELWAVSQTLVEAVTLDTQTALLAARTELAASGFLKFELEDATLAEQLAGNWRKTLRCGVLFEYQYQDSDEASSLISEVPVEIDTQFDEHMVVRGDLVRWDMAVAPKLIVEGPAALSGVSLLSHLPLMALTGTITFTRTFEGAPPPSTYSSFDNFLAATCGNGPVERNGSFTFATVNDLTSVLTEIDGGFTLANADPDLPPDLYDARSREFAPALRLPSRDDRLEISFGAATLDVDGVIYLRVMRGSRKT